MEEKKGAPVEERKEEAKVAKKYEEGTVVKGPGDAIYVIGEKGERRVIPDVFTYVKLGIVATDITHLSKKALEEIPEGEPIPVIEPRKRTQKATVRLAELVRRLG